MKKKLPKADQEKRIDLSNNKVVAEWTKRLLEHVERDLLRVIGRDNDGNVALINRQEIHSSKTNSDERDSEDRLSD